MIKEGRRWIVDADAFGPKAIERFHGSARGSDASRRWEFVQIGYRCHCGESVTVTSGHAPTACRCGCAHALEVDAGPVTAGTLTITDHDGQASAVRWRYDVEHAPAAVAPRVDVPPFSGF